MKAIVGSVMITCCLVGCSELKVIGDATIRELRADAIAVNWSKTEGTHQENKVPLEQVASVKVKSFSSFRKQKVKNAPVKGLWEQSGS